jgi:adenylate kinase family enzyme
VRVAIVGNSGSGKSTLARSLAVAHGLAHLDLDSLAWEPGQIAVARDPVIAAADVAAFCRAHARWVVEGCYAELVRAALFATPLLVFLEPGVEACRAHCRARPWEPHKYPSREEQDRRLPFLLSWVEAYYQREGDLSLRAHQALFDGYEGPKQQVADPAIIRWPAGGPAAR